MSFQRRASAFDIGRRDHTRWLGSSRYAGGAPLTLPLTGALAVYDMRTSRVSVDGGVTCSGLTDLSGGARHAVQGTGSRRAAYGASSGGFPSLLFDGTDDCLTATLSSTAGVKTLYAVIDPTADTGARALLGDMTGLLGAGALSGTHRANDGSWRDSGVAYASGLQRVAYQLGASGGFVFRKNGTAASPATWTTNPSSSAVAIGAANGSGTWAYKGHLLWWGLYGAAWNADVAAYLQQEYGV